MLKVITACFFALIATTLSAQERPSAILVMDGSGSMWGQIDGKTKIEIAQDVVGTVLETLPADQALGLTLYGHRRKGDCTDIETVVAPALGTKGAITTAVNGISPKGKTPMTEAVRQAAIALRYTEETATVILVSDGIETCDPDPCAAARALEQAGVDFTAHVVGFDVSEAEALRQMQCIADETGGTFHTASNADELSTAMVQIVDVVEAPEPAPPLTVTGLTFRAQLGKYGPFITTPLNWEILQNGSPVGETALSATHAADLDPGEYTARATRPEDGLTREAAFTVADSALNVIVMFPAPPVTVQFQARDGKNGPPITDPLVWDLHRGETLVEGPLNVDRFSADLEKGEYRVTVMRPSDEASAEAIFGVGRVNKKVVVELPEYRPAASLEAAETATVGSTIPVRWTGPDTAKDFIALRKIGDSGYINYTYTAEGSPLDLVMPPEAGSYEIAYILNDHRKTLATHPIEITAVEASITPPAALPAGSSVQVRWTGPDYKNDFIAVFPRGERKRYESYAYTREGSPLDLQLPSEPGSYDIAYVLAQDRTTLAIAEVEIAAVSASITPPATLNAGSSVQVGWEGPDNKNDFIAVFPRGERKRYESYTYTREGSPLDLQLPAKPGAYDIAYVQAEGRNVLSVAEVEIAAVSASVTPPDTLTIGSSVQIGWEGPDDKNDFIAVFPRGERKRYESYTYTREGSPLDLQLPAKPGAYDIAYVQAEGRNVLSVAEVEIAPVTATLTLGTLTPQGKLPVEWEGPDNNGDFIAIFPAGGDRYLGYAYTRDGSPAMLTMPDRPGDYVVKYLLKVDRTPIAEVPVTLE
ncbi:VWA domain-containing protein [Vannielia sp.]|uniref:vWA domain-containing protein n=1 Tax=Vannielia sp. TaxID=2813045 RepID=UPI0026313F7E|nr:VWA domain-containing protein [Vannielia sp.]MDF1871565.1 VWA domain-containing protein [Vannielia sp.]